MTPKEAIIELEGAALYLPTIKKILALKMAKEALEKQAIIAETSDKYRWHDLRKDPTDLPQDIDTKMVCIISCSNPKGRRLYTDLRYIQEDYGWGVNPVNYEVIAWREIEPFEEIQL